MRPFAWLAMVVCVGALATSAAATSPTPARRLELDAASTVIRFHLPGGLHDTHGTFRLKHGVITVAGDGRRAGGEIVVDATSGDSGLEARDRRMRREVLETDAYPEIRFRPTAVEARTDADGTIRGTLSGILTLHGTEHEIVVDVEGRVSGDHATGTGRFSVPYVEWGLEDPSLLFLTVDDTVEIEAHVEGTLPRPGSPVQESRR